MAAERPAHVYKQAKRRSKYNWEQARPRPDQPREGEGARQMPSPSHLQSAGQAAQPRQAFGVTPACRAKAKGVVALTANKGATRQQCGGQRGEAGPCAAKDDSRSANILQPMSAHSTSIPARRTAHKHKQCSGTWAIEIHDMKHVPKQEGRATRRAKAGQHLRAGKFPSNRQGLRPAQRRHKTSLRSRASIP